MNVEESARRQIAQELKINQSSQCPYVVVCYQSFYSNGAISIILEYMDGGSLADFLKKVKTIPEEYLAAICEQVENYMWFMLLIIISTIALLWYISNLLPSLINAGAQGFVVSSSWKTHYP